MIARTLAAAVRRRHTDSRGSCSIATYILYVEPFGSPEWAVRVKTFEYEREVARGKSLIPTLWAALRAPNIGQTGGTHAG